MWNTGAEKITDNTVCTKIEKKNILMLELVQE
jgi:hypothetical protein